jgi:septum formation protein
MQAESPTVILGSASPRRAELLAQLGLTFEICPADIDERPAAAEHPRDYVRRMAREKAAALAASSRDAVLLTADTTVVLGHRSLGKPESAREARAMLQALSDGVHEVSTAVCVLRSGQMQEALVTTSVEFIALDDDLIDDYLSTAEPWDKAGAYAIQGLAGSFVKRIDGSVSNVIGLPLVETRELLGRSGLRAGVRRGAG